MTSSPATTGSAVYAKESPRDLGKEKALTIGRELRVVPYRVVHIEGEKQKKSRLYSICFKSSRSPRMLYTARNNDVRSK